jgi:hypothetical protein
MALLSGPDSLLRNLLSTVGVLHGSTHTPSARHSFIEATHSGNFGEIWWLEFHIAVCNRDGMRLPGYGGNATAIGLIWEILDPEGHRYPNNQSIGTTRARPQQRERRVMTRMKSRSDSFPASSSPLNRRGRLESREINPQSAMGCVSPISPHDSHLAELIDSEMSAASTRARYGCLLLEDPQGGASGGGVYRCIFYSHESCLVSFHLLLNNEHLRDSPTPYYWGNLGPSMSLFDQERGNILYASSVLTINGWPDANSPEHLRVMDTNSGWLTEGTGTETVVVGFQAIVCLEKIHLLNWAARRSLDFSLSLPAVTPLFGRYQIAVRRFVPDSPEESEEDWICLRETPVLTPIRAGACKVSFLLLPSLFCLSLCLSVCLCVCVSVCL